MEENNVMTNVNNEEESSFFDLKNLYTIFVLNLPWILFSVILCVSVAVIYLRYTTPIHMANAKLLVKEEESYRSRNALLNTATMGMMTNSQGIDNEMEILKSHSIATDAVRDLKLYVTYKLKGRIKNQLIYQTQPITVDIDREHLDGLASTIQMEITYAKGKYNVIGSYYTSPEENVLEGPFKIEKSFDKLPTTINTRTGKLTFTSNKSYRMDEGQKLYVNISSPKTVAYKYLGALGVSQTSKNTNIASLSLVDEIPQRAIDYLEVLVECYNRQANEDKNEIAVRTEEFINGRLQKIVEELGGTEGKIENFKRSNEMIEFNMSASATMQNANAYNQKLIEVNTQIALLKSMQNYIDMPENKYQTLPANVGLSDASASSLINKYNDKVLERNHLLTSAAPNSPSVTPLTSILDDLTSSIRRALAQALQSQEIEKNSINNEYKKYKEEIAKSPGQQRVMNEIGRQQEVQTTLFTMLLQKREENSISLAATANKGKLIDKPSYGGLVKPKKSMILMVAFAIGIGVPFLLLFLLDLMRYKIEGHEDVTKLTHIPVIADVAVANEQAKSRADLVVHENKNNMMEEIFRAMRTNIQFMLEEDQKVIMATSSISGEGKTFNISNLAMSFALLGKKVVLVGLDIRKPRLAELFEIKDHHHGITPLLTMLNPTEQDIMANVVSSEVNDNLKLLLAGPIPPNPAELVERPQLDTIFEVLRKNFDYVLIDTAPVGLVTDTLSIGRVADICITICRADYTPKDNILMLDELVRANKLPKAALVINGIDMSKKKHSYYYGYGRYGRYGHYGRRYKSYKSYGYGYGTSSVYGNYGGYGNYSKSHYSNKADDSVKI